MPSASITDFLRALEDAARILIASSFWFNPSEGKSIQGERKKNLYVIHFFFLVHSLMHSIIEFLFIFNIVLFKLMTFISILQIKFVLRSLHTIIIIIKSH